MNVRSHRAALRNVVGNLAADARAWASEKDGRPTGHVALNFDMTGASVMLSSMPAEDARDLAAALIAAAGDAEANELPFNGATP